MKDADTGEPLVNVLVRLTRFAGNLFSDRISCPRIRMSRGITSCSVLRRVEDTQSKLRRRLISRTAPTGKKLDNVAASFEYASA